MSRMKLGMLGMALLGSVWQLGCIVDIFYDGFWLDLGRSALYELVWDNDAILDFFGDSAPGLIL